MAVAWAHILTVHNVYILLLTFKKYITFNILYIRNIYYITFMKYLQETKLRSIIIQLYNIPTSMYQLTAEKKKQRVLEARASVVHNPRPVCNYVTKRARRART